MTISNVVSGIVTSKPVQSLATLLESRPVASRAAIGAASAAVIALAAISYVDTFHPEHSMEIRRLIEYQAPDGWKGAVIIPLIYASAAAGAGSLVGMRRQYLNRIF